MQMGQKKQYFADNYLENDVVETIRLKMDEKNTEEQIMSFLEQKELYLKALLGVYGSIDSLIHHWEIGDERNNI